MLLCVTLYVHCLSCYVKPLGCRQLTVKYHLQSKCQAVWRTSNRHVGWMQLALCWNLGLSIDLHIQERPCWILYRRNGCYVFWCSCVLSICLSIRLSPSPFLIHFCLPRKLTSTCLAVCVSYCICNCPYWTQLCGASPTPYPHWSSPLCHATSAISLRTAALMALLFSFSSWSYRKLVNY